MGSLKAAAHRGGIRARQNIVVKKSTVTTTYLQMVVGDGFEVVLKVSLRWV
jgi:hypothetical protein